MRFWLKIIFFAIHHFPKFPKLVTIVSSEKFLNGNMSKINLKHFLWYFHIRLNLSNNLGRIRSEMQNICRRKSFDLCAFLTWKQTQNWLTRQHFRIISAPTYFANQTITISSVESKPISKKFLLFLAKRTLRTNLFFLFLSVKLSGENGLFIEKARLRYHLLSGF